MSERLRKAIESTRLGFDVRESDIRSLVEEAVSLKVRSVCVPPRWVSLAGNLCRGSGGEERPLVITVANFPLGDGTPDSVRAESFAVAEAGADEIDLVVPTGLTLDRNWRGVEEMVGQAMAPGLPVKSILETAALEDQLVEEVARVAAGVGVRWVKTSTGFHPAGGASEHSVRILRRSVPAEVGVKAAGGIRDAEYAVTLLDAGADLLGTSSAAAILKE